jgi:membrane-bound ClpP family serine protease
VVRVRGELWQAVTPEPVKSGETLRIVRIEGLTLMIERPRT